MNTETESNCFIKRIAGTPEDFRGFNTETDELACQLEENGADEQKAFRDAAKRKTTDYLMLVEQEG